MQALGIDGCRAGWLYVSKDLDTGALRGGILRQIGDLLAFDPREVVVGIDIPIGLPDSGARACELQARRLLGRPRASSVFPVPVRQVLVARSRLLACSISQRIDGRRINHQTWNIIPKIREVDRFLGVHPVYRARIHEVHPELSFQRWNGGLAMEHSKKTAQGRLERQRLVDSLFGEPCDVARAGVPRGGWALDDYLDACAVLWTACRIARSVAVTIPEKPQRDGLGLQMRITT